MQRGGFAFQGTQSDATLGLVIHVLLLQEVHIGDAQTLRILVVALIRIPFVLLHIAVAWLIRVHARLVNGARTGASAEELVSVFGLSSFHFLALGRKRPEKRWKVLEKVRIHLHTFGPQQICRQFDEPVEWPSDWATSDAPFFGFSLRHLCKNIFVGYQTIWGCIGDKAIKGQSNSITKGR